MPNTATTQGEGVPTLSQARELINQFVVDGDVADGAALRAAIARLENDSDRVHANVINASLEEAGEVQDPLYENDITYGALVALIEAVLDA